MQDNRNTKQGTHGRLIVILGMHRSGTSAITRAMATLGADFGNNLMPSVAGMNDKGFFEDMDVNRLNIELMNTLGIDWHTVGDLDIKQIDPVKLDALQARALVMLRGKTTGKIFALKDPRLARLMDFWQPVFDRIGVPVSYVIAVRNPMSVVRSLAKRDGFAEEKSYLLWLAHVVPALMATRESQRVLVDYDTLLDAPGPELERMAATLGLPLDVARLAQFAEQFLEDGLRHTRFQQQDLDLVRAAPHAVRQMFRTLDRICRDGKEDDALGAAVEIGRQFLEDLTPLLRYELRIHNHIVSQNAAAAERDRKIAELSAASTGRDRQLVESQQQTQLVSNKFRETEVLLARAIEREQVATRRIAELEHALATGQRGQPGQLGQLGQGGRSPSEAFNPVLNNDVIRIDLATKPREQAVTKTVETAIILKPVGAKHAARTIFSFVVDTDPKFAYGGYHLARSLIEHSSDEPADIHVQFTPEVPAETRGLFRKLGCSLHEIQRFGDGRYCNKIAQLANLHAIDFAYVVLLDTDMIAVADLRPFVRPGALSAKMVDLPNPSIEVLAEVGRLAGMQTLPELVSVDAAGLMTYAGNCNGGFYAIPKSLCQAVDTEWRRWALWLLDHNEPLGKAGKQIHVDQVSIWLAIHLAAIPFQAAPSNVNYYVHMNGEHRYFEAESGIALIHYHDVSLNVVGKLEPQVALNELARAAIAKANEQISRSFENTVFWNLRYARFPERGSGVGSRGANLTYKRQLLAEHGIERAGSVLDVGCGDLEMISVFDIQHYLGLDSSDQALQMARRTRPEWTFVHVNDGNGSADVSPREMVLCFEVLIHQPKEADYRKLIDFLAVSTEKTLIVSGYAEDYESRKGNSMVFFYEPLEQSLSKTGKFSSIRKIGTHTDVSVFRCDV